MSDPVLERFHRVLLEEIRARSPAFLTEPFTVAEIYQNLAPYGSHRDRIGVEMNGDYEHLLLRLLSGEGGYLLLDSQAALDEIQAELAGSNPNTGMYRDFAAVEVRLGPTQLDLSVAPDVVPDEAVVEAKPEAEAEPPPAATESTSAKGKAAATASARSQTPSRTSNESRAGCLWCGEALPTRDRVNFCPYCGTDLTLVPCRSCGEAIEHGWRFCTVCGTEAEA